MKTWIVYDSVFGNTEKVALALAEGLRSAGEVTVTRVGEANLALLDGVDLLLVGSPTRAFQPTPAIKDFLKALPASSLKGRRVSGFDTRVDVKTVNSWVLNVLVTFFGYAAEPIQAGLKRKGGSEGGKPGAFFVLDKEGPLKEGELKRAADWARGLIE